MVRLIFWSGVLVSTMCATALAQPEAADEPTPAPVAGLTYDAPFFPNATYDRSLPTVSGLVGFEAGQRAATHGEIERCLQEWAAQSDRARLTHYATTYEGRALYYIAISSPRNIARLDEIRKGMASLADPRQLGEAEGERLTQELPAVAWLAYSIHGDETSGSDAALALIYHLLASMDDEVETMLNDLVIIIDPMMNPDGRDRFLRMIAEARGANPNIDDQSSLHAGVWPWGRGNHFYFDLNRDWIFGVHPETRGRIRAVREWKPLLFIDAHEMGPQDTYLFSPAREPINPFFPERRRTWALEFARDQAAAFDRYGWRYYSGEWNDNWYPGYSDAWASLGGAVGILYEQAAVSDAGIRRREGTVLTYRETVHHQAVSSLANLRTLHRHRQVLLSQFLNERRHNIQSNAKDPRTYAIPPSPNTARRQGLLDLLELQGLEMHVATEDLRFENALDRLGRCVDTVTLPKGTILVSTTQPEAPLARALLEFDPHMSEAFLVEERRELLRHNTSRLYDTSAWNLPMMHDVEAYALDAPLPAAVERYERPTPTPGGVDHTEAQVGFVFTGHDDRSVALAARLLERDVQVRVARRDFLFDGQPYPRGSIVVTRDDNRLFSGDLIDTLNAISAELGVRIVGFDSGQADGDLPDLGGEFFQLLQRPRIAIVSHGLTQPDHVGEIWFNLDRRLGVRTTLLPIEFLSDVDLRRYNVLILPETYGQTLEEDALNVLKDWTSAGGVLIAIGDTAAALAAKDAEFSSVRLLGDAFENLDSYRMQLVREWLGRTSDFDLSHVWSHTTINTIERPFDCDPPITDAEEWRRLDAWQSIFMPQGAIVAARTDDRHWLTMGASDVVPVIIGDAPLFMVDQNAQAPIRLGAMMKSTDAEVDEDDEARWAGWAPLPAGHEMRLRMSGLLWPEAAHRIANSAWLSCETLGHGQVILFATRPGFRGGAIGSTRFFFNAVVFGPGFASTHVIDP